MCVCVTRALAEAAAAVAVGSCCYVAAEMSSRVLPRLTTNDDEKMAWKSQPTTTTTAYMDSTAIRHSCLSERLYVLP